MLRLKHEALEGRLNFYSTDENPMTYIYDEFMHKLKTQENFSLVRYGDGEWAVALKKEPTYSIILRRFEKIADTHPASWFILKNPQFGCLISGQ